MPAKIHKHREQENASAFALFILSMPLSLEKKISISETADANTHRDQNKNGLKSRQITCSELRIWMKANMFGRQIVKKIMRRVKKIVD